MARIAVEVQNGRYLDYVPGSDVAVGDVVPLTTFCGVAMTDIPSGTVGTIAAEGVFEVPAVNDAAFAPGDRVYWNAATNRLSVGGGTFADWQKRGQDLHSVVGDPLFVNPAEDDFTLKPGSPAFGLGFKPIDTSKIGLLTRRQP